MINLEFTEKEKSLLYYERLGVADLRYESSFVGFLKPRSKLTFRCDAQLAFIL
jgi:hypothetical protein